MGFAYKRVHLSLYDKSWVTEYETKFKLLCYSFSWMDLNLHKFTKGIKLIIGTVEKGIYYERKIKTRNSTREEFWKQQKITQDVASWMIFFSISNNEKLTNENVYLVTLLARLENFSHVVIKLYTIPMSLPRDWLLFCTTTGGGMYF